jgi:hypothetical protein
MARQAMLASQLAPRAHHTRRGCRWLLRAFSAAALTSPPPLRPLPSHTNALFATCRRAEARARRGGPEELELYRVRVLPREGLVYASAAPARGSAADLEALAVPGDPAARVGASPPAAGASAAAAAAPSAAADGGQANATSSSSSAAAAAAPAGPAGWARVTELSPGLPLTAIGALDGVDEAGYRTGCTATLFAKSAAVTAAVWCRARTRFCQATLPVCAVVLTRPSRAPAPPLHL